jgi:hypothetical protein
MRVYPTPTATPAAGSIFIDGYSLKRVIGNRLSPVIYGYTANGWLYRSPDNGETWALVSTNPAVDDFVMSPANPNVLYSGKGQDCSFIVDDQPMYKSVNGGMTFVPLAGANNLRPLLAHGSEETILFAASCTNLYLTTDGGVTWSERDGGNAVLWRTHLVKAIAAAYFTGDPKPTAPNWDYLYAVANASDGTAVIAASADNGATWQDISMSVNSVVVNASAIQADPEKAGVLWVTDGQGVWSTQDIESGWKLIFAGLQDTMEQDGANVQLKLNGIVAHPDGNLYLATVRGLYLKPASGESWVKAAGNPFDAANVENMLFTDSNPNLLWLNTSLGVFTYQLQ